MTQPLGTGIPSLDRLTGGRRRGSLHLLVGDPGRRLISVLEVRTRDYDRRIREFEVGEDGLRVGKPFEDAEGLLSGLARFRTAEGSG